MKSLFIKLFILLFLLGGLQANEQYSVDAKHSTVYYKSLADILFFIDNSILGVNQKIQGQINVVDNKLINGKIIIDIKGFDTDNSYRDSDVMSILGYETEQHIIFTINKTETTQGQLYLVGELEVNSVAKEIKMPVVKTYIDNSITYSGKLDVKYSDFGMTPPTLAGFIKKAKESLEIGATITFVKDN
ncbi:MAG TPA: YceI family protein [Sulfurimonas sp.]|nr:YceI family protein [Sulfurimonas sp.]